MKIPNRTFQALLAGALLCGCLSDYKDSYKLREEGRYRPVLHENTLKECSDLADNDKDGLVDCDDPECGVFEKCYNNGNSENTLARCSDKIDNDSNGLIDCLDPKCGVFQVCNPDTTNKNAENTVGRCSDKIDNDKNGQIDCADTQCKAFQICVSPDNAENTLVRCADKIDNDNNGFIDCADNQCKAFQICISPDNAENTLARCGDKIDNDNNGQIDCADAQCKAFQICITPDNSENTLARCGDKIDNDNNGLIDCKDPKCLAFQICTSDTTGENTEAKCKDKVDNNGNGLVDCADIAGCSSFIFCQPPVENTPALCTDGTDNDRDGFLDCKDSDCRGFLVCNPTENTLTLCKDGKDNDADGLIDCKDPDCKDLYTCSVPKQDTVFIIDYKTTGRLVPGIKGTSPPYNLNWYFNGGDVAGGDSLGIKGIYAGRNEQVSTCNAEPLCRKITYTATWGIAFTIFFDNAGKQDTIDLSSWVGTVLRFSIQSQIADLRVKIESRGFADAVEIPLKDVGYDPTKTTWQAISIPLISWTSSAKMQYNRLPFSLFKPEGPGGVVLIENIRFEE